MNQINSEMIPMKQTMRQFFSLTLGALAVLSLHATSARAASEPIMLKSGDVEIAVGQPLEVTVDLPPGPADHEAVLEFTAWFQASTFRGYSAAMKISWDGNDLIEALNRPEAFHIKDGRRQPAHIDAYWSVPIIDAPESAGLLTDSPYFVSPEKVDVVRFRFALPEAQPGQHSLKITNGRQEADDNTTLMARDIKIVFVPKSELPKQY